MSVTCGFFNSVNGDRKYDAVQMSSLFDGIIVDGVFKELGDRMMISEYSGMQVRVGSGRCWFDHTWTLNDSRFPITIPDSDLILNRIDAIVVDVYTNINVRNNTIKVVKGTPASNPARPALIKETGHNQYPLAYIAVNAGAKEIRTANITNMVGTTDCPFARAPLDRVTVDQLLVQWRAQWDELVKKFESVSSEDYRNFLSILSGYYNDVQDQIRMWFDNLLYIFDGDVALNMQQEIDSLKSKVPARLGPFESLNGTGGAPWIFAIEFPYVKSNDLIKAFVAPMEEDPLDSDTVRQAQLMKTRRKELSKIDSMEVQDGLIVFTSYNKLPGTFDVWLSGFSSPVSFQSYADRYTRPKNFKGDLI